MTQRNKILAFGGLAALAVSAFAAQSARQLVIDGKMVSSNVTQEGGHYLVPVDDVATYFGYTMSVEGMSTTLTKIPAPPAISVAATAPTTTPAVYGQSNLLPTMALSTEPTQISTSIGQSASVGGFDYTVTSIKDTGAKYVDLYDQRATALHPKWKTDSLVVVNIDETNRGTSPVPAVLPNAADITVFDNQKIGYHATNIDVRQASGASTSETDYEVAATDFGSSNLMIGPGGTLHFAAIASAPKNVQITSVMVNIGSRGPLAMGSPTASITVNR